MSNFATFSSKGPVKSRLMAQLYHNRNKRVESIKPQPPGLFLLNAGGQILISIVEDSAGAFDHSNIDNGIIVSANGG